MTATIDRVIVPGVYLVLDQAKRKHRAQSAELWRRGEVVTVIDGQITGRANRRPVTNTYEV